MDLQGPDFSDSRDPIIIFSDFRDRILILGTRIGSLKHHKKTTNRFLLSNSLSGDVCVLARARHVARTLVRIPARIEFQRFSVRIRLSCYIRIRCFMVRARHVVPSSKLVLDIYSIVVCSYTPIFALSKL